MITLAEYIEKAKPELEHLYKGPELQQLLFAMLEEVKGFSRVEFSLKKHEELGSVAEKRLEELLQQLKTGKPLQYVLGHAWFCGMKLKVSEDVLIPRPETEELVEWILARPGGSKGVGAGPDSFTVLDIGTGSGCIAIAIKKSMPEATVQAIDISGNALKIAVENAADLETDISFQQGDILSPEFQNTVNGKFDVIVSNPPYVLMTEMDSMADQVKKFEPTAALFVSDDDPLVFYKAIAGFAITHLKDSGQLYFEVNSAMGKEVKIMLEEKGFGPVVLKKDLSGNFRVIKAGPDPSIP